MFYLVNAFLFPLPRSLVAAGSRGKVRLANPFESGSFHSRQKNNSKKQQFWYCCPFFKIWTKSRLVRFSASAKSPKSHCSRDDSIFKHFSNWPKWFNFAFSASRFAANDSALGKARGSHASVWLHIQHLAFRKQTRKATQPIYLCKIQHLTYS